ncbi:MAG: tetratricopeptide repeat protein [Dolichospermum sp.]
MKQRLFSQWCIGLVQTVTLASLTALTTIATTNQPSHAKGHTFYCGKSKGIPVTFVRTQDSRIDFDQINSSSVTVKGDILSQGFSEPPKTTKQKVDDLLVQAADKYEIGDYRGSILAYDQVIRLTPNYADAYSNRGLVRYELGDKFQAISDFKQAAKLYQQQGENEDYQDALNRIRKLQP